MISSTVTAFSARPGIKQLIKFCIVGASSFTIDIGLLNLFLYGLHWPLLLAKTTSFLLAVGNGFYWNRKWTFRATSGEARKQYPKFVASNTIGLLLNLGIMTGAILLATQMDLIHTNRTLGEVVRLLMDPAGRKEFSPMTVNLATVVATIFVTAWNFTAAKLWTFKN